MWRINLGTHHMHAQTLNIPVSTKGSRIASQSRIRSPQNHLFAFDYLNRHRVIDIITSSRLFFQALPPLAQNLNLWQLPGKLVYVATTQMAFSFHSHGSLFLTLCIFILILPSPAVAFGAGNIPSISTVEGTNWRHGG